MRTLLIRSVVGGPARGYLQPTMRRRTRLFASGFIALGMTLSLGEAVLASMCAPELGVTGHGAVDATSPRGMSCCRSAAMREAMMPRGEGAPGQNSPDDAHGRAVPHPDHDGRDEAPCPFGPVAGAPGCTAVASLPAYVSDDLAPSPESAIAAAFYGMRPDASFTNTLFHPPKP